MLNGARIGAPNMIADLALKEKGWFHFLPRGATQKRIILAISSGPMPERKR
jgi:hypothetical protein